MVDETLITYESEDYRRADWMPVIESFDKNEELVPNHWPTLEVGELLFDEENETGDDLLYYRNGKDTGGFWLTYSPKLRKQDGLMLEGTIECGDDFSSDYLLDAYHRIVKEHATSYIQPSENMDQVAHIQIPEEYETNLVELTVDAGIKIIKDVRELQDQLSQTADNYEP